MGCPKLFDFGFQYKVSYPKISNIEVQHKLGRKSFQIKLPMNIWGLLSIFLAWWHNIRAIQIDSICG